MIYVPSWPTLSFQGMRSKLHLKHRNHIKALFPSEITERNRDKGAPSGEALVLNIGAGHFLMFLSFIQLYFLE